MEYLLSLISLIFDFFRIIIGWDLEHGYIITFILFLATSICCDKSKKISFKIYSYLAINFVLAGFLWVLIFVIGSDFNMGVSSLFVCYLIFCLIGLIYILIKYFSCKEFISYLIFIMFILSLAPYTLVATLFIYATLSF